MNILRRENLLNFAEADDMMKNIFISFLKTDRIEITIDNESRTDDEYCSENNTLYLLGDEIEYDLTKEQLSLLLDMFRKEGYSFSHIDNDIYYSHYSIML